MCCVANLYHKKMLLTKKKAAAGKEKIPSWQITSILKLLGAERFMASWHKSEEDASKLRAPVPTT